jgi:hypothetical protein
MKRTLGLQLTVYSLLLPGLSVLAWAAEPAEVRGRSGVAVLLTGLTILSFVKAARFRSSPLAASSSDVNRCKPRQPRHG